MCRQTLTHPRTKNHHLELTKREDPLAGTGVKINGQENEFIKLARGAL